jgi:hypothetical protein
MADLVPTGDYHVVLTTGAGVTVRFTAQNDGKKYAMIFTSPDAMNRASTLIAHIQAKKQLTVKYVDEGVIRYISEAVLIP